MILGAEQTPCLCPGEGQPIPSKAGGESQGQHRRRLQRKVCFSPGQPAVVTAKQGRACACQHDLVLREVGRDAQGEHIQIQQSEVEGPPVHPPILGSKEAILQAPGEKDAILVEVGGEGQGGDVESWHREAAQSPALTPINRASHAAGAAHEDHLIIVEARRQRHSGDRYSLQCSCLRLPTAAAVVGAIQPVGSGSEAQAILTLRVLRGKVG